MLTQFQALDFCHAEKVATQMSKSCIPNGQWAVLMDNPTHLYAVHTVDNFSRLVGALKNNGIYVSVEPSTTHMTFSCH